MNEEVLKELKAIRKSATRTARLATNLFKKLKGDSIASTNGQKETQEAVPTGEVRII